MKMVITIVRPEKIMDVNHVLTEGKYSCFPLKRRIRSVTSQRINKPLYKKGHT